MGRIGLIGENSVEYIDMLLDIWNGGDCAVLIDWRIPYRTAVEMMKEAKVQNCYIQKKVWDKVPEKMQEDIEFAPFERKSNTAQLLPSTIYDKFKENYSGDEAVVLYSSGTTGRAKGIILSHYAINTNADAIIDYMRPAENDCIYIAKTLSHSSTLTGELLVALKMHMKLVVAPTIVPPRYVLGNVRKFMVTIICLNPTLLSMYAEEHMHSRCDLSSLKTIYVSGSILSDRVYQRASEAFSGIAIYNVYGLSEAGPRVTAQRADCCKSNSVGKPIKGIEIVIVDENGDEAKQFERGVVHVNTPSNFVGYISGSEKHNPLYKNWLNTGDIGYIDDNGELHIVDRLDDVIIIDSHKIYPSDVEELIQKVIEVNECAVIKIDQDQNEMLGCLYVAGTIINAENIKAFRSGLMQYEIPKKFVKTDAIPKNRNGKRNYDDIRELLYTRRV